MGTRPQFGNISKDPVETSQKLILFIDGNDSLFLLRIFTAAWLPPVFTRWPVFGMNELESWEEERHTEWFHYCMEKKNNEMFGFFYFLWRPQVVLTELFRCHTGNRSNCISVTDHRSATSNRPEAKAAEMNGCCVQAPVHSHTDYINISPRQRSWTWFRWSVTHTAEQ